MLLVLVLQPTKAWLFGAKTPAKKDTLLVFGADYEDDGINLPEDDKGLHLFSDGEVWPEYLACNMKNRLLNWAVSGAKTDSDNKDFKGWSGITWQVTEYLKKFPRISENVTVAIGTDAVINEIPKADVKSVAGDVLKKIGENVAGVLQKLADAGASTIVVLNLPDYTLAPAYLTSTSPKLEDTALNTARQEIVKNFNTLLDTSVKSLTTKNPTVKFISIDFNKYWTESINKYEYKTTYAYKYADGTAVPGDTYTGGKTTTSDDIKKFAFYDAYHPSTGVHYDLAKSIQGDLKTAGILPYAMYE